MPHLVPDDPENGGNTVLGRRENEDGAGGPRACGLGGRGGDEEIL
tara:strand:+ start:141 stop:275 length:135 start_codon:yes stop_codon:yes gene_type:complete